MAETLELQLTGMAYGGEAFGRDDDGRMVFVPFALPGERVRVHVHDARKRWARAYPVEILEPSKERITPRCLHFEVCGGCHYQHIPYENQLEYKKEIVIDQLQRIGRFEDPPVNDTLGSLQAWNYRNRMRFHRSGSGELGFHNHTNSGIFTLEECHLPEGPLDLLWPEIDIEPLDAVTQVSLRCGTAGPPMVVLHAAGKPDIEALVERPVSMVWESDEGTYVLAGDDKLTFDLDGRSFRVSAGSFFQVNTDMVAGLVSLVMDTLAPAADEHILDLYAGVGLFSRFLAELDIVLLAMEESAAACADFLSNLEGFETVELWATPVEEGLSEVELQPDAVLLDPPRAGISNQAFDELMRLGPDRIVYVSCDPATLSRDGKKMDSAGYRLQSVTPIDLFPQTYHIETVSLWSAV